jgi:hypothetical protein
MSTGSSRPSVPATAVRGALAAGVLLSLLFTAAWAAADKSKRASESYGLVAGTVFQESGLVLRGAEITVKPAPEGKPSVKVKTVTASSDARGEFAIRVPVIRMRYIVSVRAAGFQKQEKTAEMSGEERIDLFFRLEREPVRK